MFVRRGLPLRWRIAVLTTLAITVLSLVASVTTYFVVQRSLISDLQARLRNDAAQVAQAYDEGAPFSLQDLISAGSIFVQLYDPQGLLTVGTGPFSTSSIDFSPIDLYEQNTIKDWQGELAGRPVQVALAPSRIGAVAVIAQTSFIADALAQLARSLLFTALALIALSTLAGYLVAFLSMRPLTYLARLAARLGPDKLEPIGYEGPRDEVAQLARVLDDLVARLKVAADAQRSFLAETSHELRTPLTSLQGFLDRASRQAYPGVKRDLDDAKRISHTMSRLVADLLQLSRGELVREIVPHLLDPYEDILRPVAEEYPGVRVVASSGETLVGDPERLRQLIRNLTANAVRACGGDAQQVSLHLDAAGTQIVLEVRDDGPGIPEDMLPFIFDKFYKGAGGGAGLGLAIAEQIAEAHGGTLSVKSKVGEGTTFKLTLPEIETGDEEVKLTQAG